MGERVADTYDDWYEGYEIAAIDRLAELSNAGRALELGIGTGRIAIPLSQRGIEVHGIDASPRWSQHRTKSQAARASR